MPRNPFLETAERSARSAGELLRRHFADGPVVERTEHHDVKLLQDRLSEEVIIKLIRAEHPDHTIMTEESPVLNEGSRYMWIIDPLDGTVNFSHGVPHFSISIALCEDGVLSCGVIYDAVRGEMLTAAAGEGAYLNGKRIRVSKRARLEESVAGGGFSKSIRSIDDGEEYFLAMIRRLQKIRITGSAALDLAYVACGRFEAYIERYIFLWDIAAGTLLVREAGGKVHIETSPTDPRSYFAMATNDLIFEDLASLNDIDLSKENVVL